MQYEIVKIKKEECKTSKWSGGETTELCIYPFDGNYKERDFKWRISTATVDVETSDFSKLPKISRVLMILKGQMKLFHENHHRVTLSEFEKDTFSGEWNTKSYGKAMDFNIMMNENCIGDLNHFIVNNTIHIESYPRNETYDYTMQGFYLPEGNVSISCNRENIELESGEFVCIYYSHYEDDLHIEISSKSAADVVGIHIEY